MRQAWPAMHRNDKKLCLVPRSVETLRKCSSTNIGDNISTGLEKVACYIWSLTIPQQNRARLREGHVQSIFETFEMLKNYSHWQKINNNTQLCAYTCRSNNSFQVLSYMFQSLTTSCRHGHGNTIRYLILLLGNSSKTWQR